MLKFEGQTPALRGDQRIVELESKGDYRRIGPHPNAVVRPQPQRPDRLAPRSPRESADHVDPPPEDSHLPLDSAVPLSAFPVTPPQTQGSAHCVCCANSSPAHQS